MSEFKRIIVCGDLHGDKDKLAGIIMKNGLGEGDLLMVCGDFGFIMRNDFREDVFLDDIEQNCKFTIAFVCGNHEHFPRISEYSVTDWCGGKARMIRSNIICLMNGEVYTIPTVKGEKTFYAMGGAASVDKGYNIDRYATLWLGARSEGDELELFRSDHPDYEKLKKGMVTVHKKEDVFLIIQELYRGFLPLVKSLTPELYKDYFIDRFYTINEKKDLYSKALKWLVEMLYCPDYKDAMLAFKAKFLEILREEGFEGDNLRVVLQEGTWFREELPSNEDYRNSGRNLARHNMKVDYIISHTMPSDVIKIYRKGVFVKDDEAKQAAARLKHMSMHNNESVDLYNRENDLLGHLDWVRDFCQYKMHFIGHWHDDRAVTDKHLILFKDTYTIE